MTVARRQGDFEFWVPGVAIAQLRTATTKASRQIRRRIVIRRLSRQHGGLRLRLQSALRAIPVFTESRTSLVGQERKAQERKDHQAYRTTPLPA